MAAQPSYIGTSPGRPDRNRRSLINTLVRTYPKATGCAVQTRVNLFTIPSTEGRQQGGQLLQAGQIVSRQQQINARESRPHAPGGRLETGV